MTRKLKLKSLNCPVIFLKAGFCVRGKRCAVSRPSRKFSFVCFAGFGKQHQENGTKGHCKASSGFCSGKTTFVLICPE